MVPVQPDEALGVEAPAQLVHVAIRHALGIPHVRLVVVVIPPARFLGVAQVPPALALAAVVMALRDRQALVELDHVSRVAVAFIPGADLQHVDCTGLVPLPWFRLGVGDAVLGEPAPRVDPS